VLLSQQGTTEFSYGGGDSFKQEYLPLRSPKYSSLNVWAGPTARRGGAVKRLGCLCGIGAFEIRISAHSSQWKSLRVVGVLGKYIVGDPSTGNWCNACRLSVPPYLKATRSHTCSL